MISWRKLKHTQDTNAPFSTRKKGVTSFVHDLMQREILILYNIY